MKKLIKEILVMSQFVFDDNDFKKVTNYINNKQYNDLRLLIDREIEITQALSTITESVSDKLSKLNTMEDYVLDLYLEYQEA